MIEPAREPWDELEDDAAESTAVAQTASVWLWALGALQVLVFGCCTASIAITAQMPLEAFQQEVAAYELPPQQAAELHGMLHYSALIVLLMGFLPGVAYLICGFGVRRGKRTAIGLALLLAITQAIVFGVMGLYSLAAAAMAANPVAFTVNFVTFGTILGVLGAAIYWLTKALRFQPTTDADTTDPWNDPRL